MNHLHFQGCYSTGLNSQNQFPISTQTDTTLWPISPLVFEHDDLEQLVSPAASAVLQLNERNIAHNLLLTENGKKIYVFPRQHQISVPQSINIAFVELAGVIIATDEAQYTLLTEEDVVRYIKALRCRETVRSNSINL